MAGIGGYGNAFGCPTVGGEVVFEDCYEKNPLVNAFALGIVKADAIFKARAEGIGNPVFYVGAKTGRDGIHGATMASAEFGEGSEEKRPTVQVGDPFMEKVLLEACLEALATGAVVGIQDMGAAGLTCATSEMGSRAGTGIEIDIARVPKRETGMTAYEVMLSESQERMLLVAEKGREDEVVRVFEKWDLHAEAIGTVTGGRPPARLPRREAGGGRPRGRAHRRGAAVRPAVGAAAQSRRGGGRLRRWPRLPISAARCSPCWPRPTSPPSAGSTASTTAPCARTRSSARDRTRRWCG